MIETSAPANIALIKYMGKKTARDLGSEKTRNIPMNASLSYTTENLRTFVRLQSLNQVDPGNSACDRWKALTSIEAQNAIKLSEKSQQRFLAHLGFLKKTWDISESLLVESVNNFPSDCGIASSASSFAALTKAVALFAKQPGRSVLEVKDLATLSQQGSGSSCRSFFSPWALWDQQGVRSIEIPYGDMLHAVVIVESGHKGVSSSEAHERVRTSPLMEGRVERAQWRLEELLFAFERKDWAKAYRVVGEEFLDMHELFHTCKEPFRYLNERSALVLGETHTLWESRGDGPLVTMDAGPNVHLLFRSDQRGIFEEFTSNISNRFQVIRSTDAKKGPWT